jgi:hypothetical protein
MNSVVNALRRAKRVIGWSAPLLMLAAVVSTAPAQPKEVLVYNFDPTGTILGGSADSTSSEDGIIDRSGSGYNGTCMSLYAAPGAMKFLPGHGSGAPVSGGTTGVALATAGLDEFPFTGIYTGATTVQLGMDGSFTVMAWVNRSNLRHEDNMVFGSTITRDVDWAMHLGFRNWGTYFGFWSNDSSLDLEPTPLAGAWHHMAWRYDATKQNQDILIDGKLMNSDPNHPAFNAGDQAFLIGNASPGPSGNLQAFGGLIEYPRVFNVVLRDDQVAAAAKDLPIPP